MARQHSGGLLQGAESQPSILFSDDASWLDVETLGAVAAANARQLAAYAPPAGFRRGLPNSLIGAAVQCAEWRTETTASCFRASDDEGGDDPGDALRAIESAATVFRYKHGPPASTRPPARSRASGDKAASASPAIVLEAACAGRHRDCACLVPICRHGARRYMARQGRLAASKRQSISSAPRSTGHGPDRLAPSPIAGSIFCGPRLATETHNGQSRSRRAST